MHREPSGVVFSLEMDQESSGIELMYVCVCAGGEGRLGCGLMFYIPYSILLSFYIFYILYAICYIIYSVFYII